jgi:hypothetical protein
VTAPFTLTFPEGPEFSPSGRWRLVPYIAPDFDQSDLSGFALGARMIHIEHVPDGYEKGRGFYRILIAVPYS